MIATAVMGLLACINPPPCWEVPGIGAVAGLIDGSPSIHPGSGRQPRLARRDRRDRRDRRALVGIDHVLLALDKHPI